MRCSLVLRKEVVNARGLSRVELVVHAHGRRTRIRTGVEVQGDQWDAERRRVKATGKNAHPKAHELNRRLVAIESKAQSAEVEHPSASVDKARTLIARERSSPMASFVDVAAANVERDKKLGYHTRRTWMANLRKFDAFAPGLRTEEVSTEVIADFHTDMLRSGLANPTAVWIIRRLRIMYRRACKDIGKAPQAITEGVTMTVEQGAPRFVPKDKVPLLLEYTTSNAHRLLAIDLWRFSYLTWGMRYADLCLLKWTDIHEGWLRLTQHKTGHLKRSQLNDRALSIIERYKGGVYVFKVCGDKRATEKEMSSRLVGINEHLRSIGKELQLPHPLTTHTARHTWTEWALRNNVPWSRIMQMLGVRNMRAFEHYIAGFNQAEVEEVAARFAGQ
jgi:integrase